jgi:hypothetical protein
MGIVFEQVVAELLAEEPERTGQLRNGQYGSRKMQSAMDAAAIMIDRDHAPWRLSLIAGVLLMDIKAAFPSIGRGRLIHTMSGKRMDGDLKRWMASILTKGTVEIVIEGNVMEGYPAEVGIPQGSPVSPILFPIFTFERIK